MEIIHRSATIVVILMICTVFHENQAAISEAQLKAAVKLVRNVCQPKHKTTNEQIEMMHRGEWNIERNTMCYMACCLNMYKLMKKDNTFDYVKGIQAMNNNVPETRKEAMGKTMEVCKDSVKTKSDKCVAGYEIAKCFYESNPANYFLP